MEFGATGGDRMMVDTTCGRAHVRTQLGLARTYPLRSVLPRRDRAAPGAARLTVLEIEEPGCAAPRVEPAGGGLQLLMYQLGARLLCAGEQQGSLEVQHLAKDSNTGDQWLRATFGLNHH